MSKDDLGFSDIKKIFDKRDAERSMQSLKAINNNNDKNYYNFNQNKNYIKNETLNEPQRKISGRKTLKKKSTLVKKVQVAVAGTIVVASIVAGISHITKEDPIQVSIEMRIDKKDIKDFNSYYLPVQKAINEAFLSSEARIINEEIAKRMTRIYNENTLTKQQFENALKFYGDECVNKFKNNRRFDKSDGSTYLIDKEGYNIAPPVFAVGKAKDDYLAKVRQAANEYLDSVDKKFQQKLEEF